MRNKPDALEQYNATILICRLLGDMKQDEMSEKELVKLNKEWQQLGFSYSIKQVTRQTTDHHGTKYMALTSKDTMIAFDDFIAALHFQLEKMLTE